jgi:hypothetical protein
VAEQPVQAAAPPVVVAEVETPAAAAAIPAVAARVEISVASAAPSEPTVPVDRWNKRLDNTDRAALTILGFTEKSFNEDRGPTVPWSELSDEQRTAAMTIGMGEEEWTIAVQEEAEEQKHRDWMATEPERIAAR